MNAPYQALRTKDGYINIGAASQPTWEQFCRAIGQEALIEDERYLEPNDRKAREEELAELLEGILSEHTTAHWMEQLEAAGRWWPAPSTTWSKCTTTSRCWRGR